LLLFVGIGGTYFAFQIKIKSQNYLVNVKSI